MGPRFMEMGYLGGLHKNNFRGGGGGGGGMPLDPLAFRDFHIFLVGALRKDAAAVPTPEIGNHLVPTRQTSQIKVCHS